MFKNFILEKAHQDILNCIYEFNLQLRTKYKPLYDKVIKQLKYSFVLKELLFVTTGRISPLSINIIIHKQVQVHNHSYVFL